MSLTVNPSRIVGRKATGDLTDLTVLETNFLLGFAINVKGHGAVGDGVTDDTIAIHAARDAAGVGGEIFFPPGIYNHTGLAFNVADQKWRWMYGGSLFLINSSDATSITATADGIVIDHCDIDGNKTNQTPGTSSGINVSAADGVTVKFAKVTDAEFYGIRFINSDKPTVVDSDVFDSGNMGIFIEVNDAVDRTDIKCKRNFVDRRSLGIGISAHCIGIRSNTNNLQKWTRVDCSENDALMPLSPTSSTTMAIEIWHAWSGTFNDNRTLGGTMGMSLVRCNYYTADDNAIDSPVTQGIENAILCNFGTNADNAIDGGGILKLGITSTGQSNPSKKIALTGNNISNLQDTSDAKGVQCLGGIGLTITGGNIEMVNGIAIELGDVTDFAINGVGLDGTSGAHTAIVLGRASEGSVNGGAIKDFVTRGISVSVFTAEERDTIAINGVSFVSPGTNGALELSLSGGGTIGDNIRAVGNVGLLRNGFKADIHDLNNDVVEVWGTASPESVVTAGVSSVFHRTDGGVDTTMYIKETGTGNTGWGAVTT